MQLVKPVMCFAHPVALMSKNFAWIYTIGLTSLQKEKIPYFLTVLFVTRNIAILLSNM